MDDFWLDETYINRLYNRDPDVEAHFVQYFKKPVWNRARRALREYDLIEDACQETFRRAFDYFRSGKRLEDHRNLSAFMYGVCHNVTMEMIRTRMRTVTPPESAPEPADLRVDLHLDLVTSERKRIVAKVLEQLPERNRELLRLSLLDETDKAELCRRFGVNEGYLRVLLHRARAQLQAELEKNHNISGKE